MIVDPRPPPSLDMESELPPLSVDSMSQVQLTEFIPQLVCLVTGRQQPNFGKNQFKPEWWPDNVAWKSPEPDTDNALALQIQAQELRAVVRSCYKFLGQENLLGGANEPNDRLQLTNKENVAETSTSQEASMPNSCEASQEDPIWVCFLCAQQFADQDELMTHQDKCEQDTEAEELEPPPRPPSPPVLRARRRNVQSSHIVIQPNQIQFQPCPVQLICHRRRTFTPEPYVPPSVEDFLKALNLSDKPKEPPRVVTPVSDIDSDCEIVDVTYDETAAKTPRTPKSLMSQLSHTEHSARKRHLSFSQTLDLPEGYSSYDSDSESESGSQKTKPKIPFGTLLCSIDLTSPLGQRVKKHWKIDTNYSIIPEDRIENFCSGPLKNDFVEKLRHRGETSYPVVFNKKNRKHMTKHKHEYKFNSSQRKEFMVRLKTGLTKRSRKLLSEIVKCNVKLERLKPGVIRRWIKRKPPPPYPYAYIRRMFEQEHPIIKKIVQNPRPGPKYAKLKQISDGLRKLNRPHNLLPNQRMVTKVVQNPDGTTSMRMICTPSSGQPNPQFNNSGNNRRKQTFDQNTVRRINPEDIEIIELSSSDEEQDQPPQQTRPTGPLSQKMMHFKNITGVPQNSQICRMSAQNSSQQFQRMTMPNAQKLSNSVQQQQVSPKITSFPKQELQIPRSASPSNTRTRIFQGMKGILSPSSLPNKSGLTVHSSPPGGSTCKELMQNSKPVSGFVNRAIFKDSTPQILRNSQNSPSKILNRNLTKASSFPGYIRLDYQVTVESSVQGSSSGSPQPIYTGTNGATTLVSTSEKPLSGHQPTQAVAQPKPRDPIMESDVIVIDDED